MLGMKREIKLSELDFDKGGGLLPVVVQDIHSKEVLMLAYADESAVRATLSTGLAHYHSRSRGKLWMKGEQSGNVQKVRKILVDCDNDSLIYVVEQKGVACHTGNWSCFFGEIVFSEESR
jgi:phosphoribosyl-AMP cyclohydrolase